MDIDVDVSVDLNINLNINSTVNERPTRSSRVRTVPPSGFPTPRLPVLCLRLRFDRGAPPR